MFPFVSETNYLVIKARARNELYHQESYKDGGMLGGGERERKKESQQDGGWPHASGGVVGFLLNGERVEKMRRNQRVEEMIKSPYSPEEHAALCCVCVR